MHQQVAFAVLPRGVGERAAERDDLLDMLARRQHDARTRLDLVVEAQQGTAVCAEILEGLRVRMLGIEDRQHVGDAAVAVQRKLLDAADRRAVR